jgi:hypothetical protein
MFNNLSESEQLSYILNPSTPRYDIVTLSTERRSRAFKFSDGYKSTMDWCSVYLSPPLIFPTTSTKLGQKTARVNHSGRCSITLNGTDNLLIENGRHLIIPREQRLCSHCKCINDEKHFILHCTINSELRSSFLNILNNFSVDFTYFLGSFTWFELVVFWSCKISRPVSSIILFAYENHV